MHFSVLSLISLSFVRCFSLSAVRTRHAALLSPPDQGTVAHLHWCHTFKFLYSVTLDKLRLDQSLGIELTNWLAQVWRQPECQLLRHNGGAQSEVLFGGSTAKTTFHCFLFYHHWMSCQRDLDKGVTPLTCSVRGKLHSVGRHLKEWSPLCNLWMSLRCIPAQVSSSPSLRCLSITYQGRQSISPGCISVC